MCMIHGALIFIAYNILEEKITYEPYYIYIILQTFNYIFRKLTKYGISRSKDSL